MLKVDIDSSYPCSAFWRQLGQLSVFFHRIQFSHDRFDLFFQLILESEAREDYWGKVCACVRMRARVRVGAS